MLHAFQARMSFVLMLVPLMGGCASIGLHNKQSDLILTPFRMTIDTHPQDGWGGGVISVSVDPGQHHWSYTDGPQGGEARYEVNRTSIEMVLVRSRADRGATRDYRQEITVRCAFESRDGNLLIGFSGGQASMSRLYNTLDRVTQQWELRTREVWRGTVSDLEDMSGTTLDTLKVLQIPETAKSELGQEAI